MSPPADAPLTAVARGGATNMVGAVVYGASNFLVPLAAGAFLSVEEREELIELIGEGFSA